jgi:hypothetical protein
LLSLRGDLTNAPPLAPPRSSETARDTYKAEDERMREGRELEWSDERRAGDQSWAALRVRFCLRASDFKPLGTFF